MVKYCVLNEDKICDECGDCQRCDLDPDKICDNCMKCINSGADYSAIEIEAVQAPKDIDLDDILQDDDDIQ